MGWWGSTAQDQTRTDYYHRFYLPIVRYEPFLHSIEDGVKVVVWILVHHINLRDGIDTRLRVKVRVRIAWLRLGWILV